MLMLSMIFVSFMNYKIREHVNIEYNVSMQSTYLAVLGRQPELGLIELESVVGAEHLESFNSKLVLLDTLIDIDKYGGVVKVAEILYDGPADNLPELPLDLTRLNLTPGKTTFAISAEGGQISAHDVTMIGIELKRALKTYGSARFIAPKSGTEVSAAQLKFNRVLDKGFELILAGSKKRLIIARTVGIQDIDWYSHRDYDRPARSAKVGMLPPKLAMILANTTTAPLVVDPFCGSGVVLQEALLLGRSASGSDLSEEMVAASKQNLNWLAGEVSRTLPAWSISLSDARTFEMPKTPLAIVSEGYLGPNLTHSPSQKQLDQIRPDLRELYRDSLTSWAHQIPSGTELALCAPAWKLNGEWSLLGVVDDLPRLGYTVKVFKHVQRPVLYSRADQVVGRQLLFLRKI
jgi:tRNA G10  N-methylase Trm11